MTYPPHGLRLGEVEEVQALYKEFGDFLKTNCTGTSAFTCLYCRFGRQVYTGNPELRKSTCPTALVRRVGLKTTSRIPLDNGKPAGRQVRRCAFAN